mgnify:CR=1 FL=1|tara:strand:- start:711 stop:1235 length:525 start_codon:yes stop_codon:yes gene_type:complete
MTLGEFFEIIGRSPNLILFYFLALPLTAFLAGVLGKNEGHLSPWKYLYSSVIFLVCVPGIFAITLNIYLFLFERRSIMDANLYTQVLPIILMLITLWIVSRNVKFEEIPGFNRISGLVIVIVAVLLIMWIMEKTHIIAITFMPFYYVFIIFIALFLAIRYGLKRMWATPNDNNS